MKRLLATLGILFLIATGASAITTNAASGASTYGITLNGNHAGAGIAYFEYGTAPGSYVYRTPNQSVSGAFSYAISGWPLIGGQTYYFAAVDAEDGSTGTELSFTLSTVTTIPTSTFGNSFTGFKANKMNITEGGKNLTEPYANVFGGGSFGLAVFVGLFYAIVMVGMLIFTEDVVIPTFIGFLVAGGIFTILPPEFQQVAYAVTVIAIGGIAYTIIKGWRR
jgi:hypothetical protein